MNRTKLKNYAPQARRDFIQAVTDRAAFFGLTANNVEPVKEKGDSVLIGGKAFSRKVGEQRKQLEERVRQHGFTQTMEALAYTWFNRLVAIRFMELHDYLENGESGASYRVLSNPDKDKPTPEILEKAELVTLEMLDKEKIIDLKLEGTKEVELYRQLLIAECNALNSAMPFLFEKIDDETELVLPDNLLHSDSLIRKLVNEIAEEDWQEVEIIGWLYQFYISEKKDEVIGKVVASEDIPAATQLFTPNWIVKYLVQNTLGMQWLATYPQSGLRHQMAYYIEPAEQTPDVQEQLKAITPTSLNLEEITLLDPACGSGHILVEAYDLFKAIYQERGYRAKDIPSLILQKNLFGLEIDDRAAQLAAFALMMKARADDRRIFSSEAMPNVLAIQESKGLDARGITDALNAPILKEKMPPSQYLMEEMDDEVNPLFSRKVMSEKGHVSQTDVATLLRLFEDAKTFGSLLQVPPSLAEKLPEIELRVRAVLTHGGMFEQAQAKMFRLIVDQAEMLARLFDVGVTNPPYMGTNAMNSVLKRFAGKTYPVSKSDLYAMFIQRGFLFLKMNGLLGMVTMHSWMFLSTYQSLRETLLSRQMLVTLAHLGIGAFSELNSKVVQTVAFVFENTELEHYTPICFRLIEGEADDKQDNLLKRRNVHADSQQSDFAKMPGSLIAYWASPSVRRLFNDMKSVKDVLETREGMATADNERFLRFWCEVDNSRIGFHCRDYQEAISTQKKWFPYVKGGDYRKWYGNATLIVNWENDGAEIKANLDKITARVRSHNYNGSFAFRAGLTWTGMSNSKLSMRFVEAGYMFDAKGPMAFATNEQDLLLVQGVLNSAIGNHLMVILAPTLDFKLGHVLSVPFYSQSFEQTRLLDNVKQCIRLAKADWDTFEVSWDFAQHPFLDKRFYLQTAHATYLEWKSACDSSIHLMKSLEEENNRIIADVYRLQDEVDLIVDPGEITLHVPDAVEDWNSFASYAIGCMMGRFSLHQTGLAYAGSRNELFPTSRYISFLPSSDGIIPVTEGSWFDTDAATRFLDFIKLCWPDSDLKANDKFIASCLGYVAEEGAVEAFRSYFACEFFDYHLKMYRAGTQAPKRPIYWLFSSGKQRAFQCLIYLHRYHVGTLARMRTEYVIPLQGKIAARIEQLEGDKNKAGSTSHRKKLQKEQDDLKKKQAELFAFDEKLKHAADQKITLDLDDGVKFNYAKFGDLLTEVKAVTGGKDDE